MYKPEGSTKNATFNIPENTQVYGGFRGGETNLLQRSAKANRTVLNGDIGRIGPQVRDHHIGTPVCQRERDRGTDSVIGAGDD